jgi:hypothetical protein
LILWEWWLCSLAGRIEFGIRRAFDPLKPEHLLLKPEHLL